MTNSPTVTAVCCTHRRPLFARKAVELFQAQTWPNKELLLMDDGDPAELADLAALPGVRRVHTSGWEGMTRKQRWAYESARGDLIAIWDDDDYFSPDRLEAQATAIEKGADGVGFCIDLIASAAPARFWRWKPATLGAWEKSNTTEKPVGSQVPFHDGSVMFKKSLLEGLPAKTREEWQLGLLDAMQKRGAKFLALPNEGRFVYVRHGGNAWRFATEDQCVEVPRPEWIPAHMVEFWNLAEPAAEARVALGARDKDHNGI